MKSSFTIHLPDHAPSGDYDPVIISLRADDLGRPNFGWFRLGGRIDGGYRFPTLQEAQDWAQSQSVVRWMGYWIRDESGAPVVKEHGTSERQISIHDLYGADPLLPEISIA